MILLEKRVIDKIHFTTWTKVSIFVSLDDISHNKIATQSQTDIDIHNRYGASKAVDRNITTCTKTKPIGLNDPDKTVWWKVDLGRVSSIYSINLQFKSYDGYGMYYIGICLLYITCISSRATNQNTCPEMSMSPINVVSSMSKAPINLTNQGVSVNEWQHSGNVSLKDM